jgi:hypothetical protein
VRKDTINVSKNVLKVLEIDCYNLQVVLDHSGKTDEPDMLSMVTELDQAKAEIDPKVNPEKFKVYEGKYSIKIPNPEAPLSEHSDQEAESSSGNSDFFEGHDRNDMGSFRVGAANDESSHSEDCRGSSNDNDKSEESQESESSGSESDDLEADGGVRLDNPLKIISIKVHTSLGEDIAFVSQFHDCIIIDCVTNQKMMPIKVPGKEAGYDSVLSYNHADFKMVKVPMI